MEYLSEVQASDWLKSQGIQSSNDLENILGAFVFPKVYLQHLAPGDVIFQFIRKSHYDDLSPRRGNWFCLQGATLADLAIFSGVAGRRLQPFHVDHPLVALEGIAAELPINWEFAIGGLGGTTQLYVPPFMIARLSPGTAANRY